MSQKICPGCGSRRPVEEVFCQNQLGGDVCGWDLTSVAIDVPVAPRPEGVPRAVRCANGHPSDPGDLICRECGADVLFPGPEEESDGGGGLGEEEQPPYESPPEATLIAGWEVLGRVGHCSGATECFRVQRGDEAEGILTLYPVGVRFDQPLYEVLRSLSPKPAAAVFGVGEFEGRPFEVVEGSQAETFADVQVSGGEAAHLRQLITNLGAAIYSLSRAGIRHRDLRPEAILLRGDQRDDIAICRFGVARLSNHDLDTAAPPELSRYMAPESLAGAIAPASDWWSLGIILLEKLTDGSCFEGINDQAFLMRVVASGADIPESIDRDFNLLLRGLLARDRSVRWQWPEVQAWLNGEPVPAPAEPDKPDLEDAATITLGGRGYRKPSVYALAAAEQGNWYEARDQLVRGAVATWLEEFPGAERMRSAIRNLLRRGELDDDVRLSVALKVLNPDMPLVRAGEIVNPNWLLTHPLEGYRLISGPAPEFLQQLGLELWLSQLKQREVEVRRRAKLHDVELNEDVLRIHLLCTSRMRFEELWEEQRRQSPDSDHKGLAAIMERKQMTEEDLILLLSASKGQFRPLQELVASASELARREGVATFDEAFAATLLQRPRREVLGQLNERIENFARCGKLRLDEWADQYRLERRISLPRAAVILAVPAGQWKKPPKQDYVAQLLGFFEKRITTSVSRGALARMTITKTSPRIDLTELGTQRVSASGLLDQLLERSEATLDLDPNVFALDLALERRLRTLVSRAELLRRDTGINGLYMGFPFVLVQPRGENVKPRIAPVLLWPIRIGTEVGQRARFTVAFDRDREEVRINPALQNVFAPEDMERWLAARDAILSGSATTAAVMDEFAVLANKVRQAFLARLPGADVKVATDVVELTASAVLFHVTFVGQAIVEDIRQLRAIPPGGTGLESVLRIREASPTSVPPVPAGDGIDRFATAESDPTQDLAVLQARKAPGLVIEGPPGTGKSQTIVNMVADAIGRKKSILIVCQKQAALDVVYKRLQREGLEERLMIVRDVSKDRRPAIEAVRNQVGAMFANGAPDTTWVRQRKAVLDRIKRLEDQLNAHQEAMHRRDELSGLTYRELIGELVALEEVGPVPDAIELRAALGKMDAEHVSAAGEVCVGLVALWLPSGFENSPLALTKPFGWDPAMVSRFLRDLEAFCEAEKHRPVLSGKSACAFDVEDAEALQEWADAYRSKLCGLSQAELDELDFFIDAFKAQNGSRSRGDAVMADLAAIRGELQALPAIRSDQTLSDLVAQLSDLELDGWIAVTASATAQPSLLGRLGPRRYLKRKRVRGLLERITPAVSDAVMQRFLDTARLESQLRGLRSRLDVIYRGLGFAPQDLSRAATNELVNHADWLLGSLGRVAWLASVLGASPVREHTLRAARSRQVGAFAAHFNEIDAALTRLAARRGSLAAVDVLEPWFERDWLTMCRKRVMGNKSAGDLISPIVRALPTLVPYQQFRVRAREHSADVRSIFAALRGCDAHLKTMSAVQLGDTTRRLIRREVCLAWKTRLEHANQLLTSEHDEIQGLVRGLTEAEAELRQVNKRAITFNIDPRELRTQTVWDDITRFTGPRARRLREFVDIGSEIGLMELRPVWLMGPDVASRMLPLKKALFDTVVYDEASQMPVEFAVPSLFRGNVVVVSGDEKQLPPTSFFSNRVAVDEEEGVDFEDQSEDLTEDEREAATETWNRREIKDCPNLLELAKAVLPSVMLKVHYRSAFRELIAFSNNAFYDGQLNVPVRHPAVEVDQQRPLEVIEVNGLYDERTNKAEADRVVELLASIWRSRKGPIPSIGVVTFNRDQADLIEQCLELRAEEDEAFRAAYIRERQRTQADEDMGFFVKNVENVQGDERDQIIFSTTFGRNSRGTFRRNFGVLGQSGGERRLNVAVTRARQKVTLLTSMPLDQISGVLGSNTKPQQPRDFLQLYLAYAVALSGRQHKLSHELLNQVLKERGRPDGVRSSAADGFARSVAAFIESLGLAPTPANDGSAFGVDFAIGHPTKGTYGIGIECGAHRHPILAHARAREIWRRNVMQKAIPSIHRVSIRGWYHDRKAEQGRLRQAIEQALK